MDKKIFKTYLKELFYVYLKLQIPFVFLSYLALVSLKLIVGFLTSHPEHLQKLYQKLLQFYLQKQGFNLNGANSTPSVSNISSNITIILLVVFVLVVFLMEIIVFLLFARKETFEYSIKTFIFVYPLYILISLLFFSTTIYSYLFSNISPVSIIMNFFVFPLIFTLGGFIGTRLKRKFYIKKQEEISLDNPK